MLCVRVVRIKLNTSVSLVCVRGEGEWCGRLVALMTFSKVFNAPIWAGGVGNQSGWNCGTTNNLLGTTRKLVFQTVANITYEHSGETTTPINQQGNTRNMFGNWKGVQRRCFGTVSHFV